MAQRWLEVRMLKQMMSYVIYEILYSEMIKTLNSSHESCLSLNN